METYYGQRRELLIKCEGRVGNCIYGKDIKTINFLFCLR